MLHVHRAARADRLAEVLAGIVRRPLDDPLTPEIVAVPTRGVERWLTQRLAAHLGAQPGRGDGVCANVAFPFPGRLVNRVVAQASGIDPATDPWPAERCVWPLLEVVHDHLHEPWLAPLAVHLGHDGGTGGGRAGEDSDNGESDRGEHPSARRFSAVRHLADLFDRYGVHRPAMVQAWAAGDDTDGEGAALPAPVAWQAQLWRCLRERVVTPSPAERLATACESLRVRPERVDVPARLALFGLTRLPAGYLDVLHALAAGRDVHLLLLHPSPVLWDRIAEAVPATRGPVERRHDPTVAAPRHPLLRAWARDSREMQLVLAGASSRSPGDAVAIEHHELAPGAPLTLLARVQAAVRADEPPPGPPLPGEADRRPLLAAGDASLQVHACHGRARQVEVLRDAILHALADDPTLEPRDVIVMCPDIDSFAPLIHATFTTAAPDPGEEAPAGADRPGAELRARLADRSIRQTNPLLDVVSALLDLTASRVTASQVIDLAGREPVRRRFGFDDDELARIEEWVAATGIRWGLDADHRRHWRLDKLATGTWRAGLDRLLVGVTMAEDRQALIGGVLPLDDVDSADIDLAGRLAELLDRLDAVVASFAGSRPVAAWAEVIAEAADAVAATGDADTWQRAQLATLLDEVVTEATVGCGTAGGTGHPAALLTIEEAQALLADRLRGRPTRANFRTGQLTMCTLVPMRSVPHRLVCLLGLDDGAFPRGGEPDGDDLTSRIPRVGDDDPRSEDRQLLLDALSSATGSVIVTYSGRDERTNEVRPPAVPLGELLDVLDATVRTADGRPARDHVVTKHPLQPFDTRNFTSGALGRDGPWSFDRVALGGARAAAGPRAPAPPLLDRPLPPDPAPVVELDELVRFVQHPVRAFLRQRLGISVRDGEEEPSDALPVELDALERWGVGQRLLDALLAGADEPTCRAAELARGLLPPGALGVRLVDSVLPAAAGIARAAGDGSGAGSLQVDVDLGGGRSLVGTVADVAGDVIRAATYSRVGPRHRLASWVRLLAVTATRPDLAVSAVTVGRGPRGTVSRVTIPPQRPERARAVLGTLIDLHDRGRCEPLPLFEKTSAAYAEARGGGRDRPRAAASAAAREEWESTFDRDREDRRPEHQLAFGGTVGFGSLLAQPPAPGESGAGWAADEPDRFGRLARRLWDDLLAVEQVAAR